MKQVFSIGHSNLDIGSLCTLLRQAGVVCLADIRSVPFSRFNPQFNQQSLARSLQDAGIAYVFLGNELGGRIKNVACYKDKSIPDKQTGYALHLDYDAIIAKAWFIAGMDRLLGLIDQGNCAIMCSEENPGQCHRELIVGRRLKELGYGVAHIRSKPAANRQLGLF